MCSLSFDFHMWALTHVPKYTHTCPYIHTHVHAQDINIKNIFYHEKKIDGDHKCTIFTSGR